METDFTPISALLGGGLIGLAAVIKMATNGKIAGISGIVSRLLPPEPNVADFKPGLAFVFGLIVAVPIYLLFAGAPAQSFPTSGILLVVAGLLVGFGSVWGNGCTSGHGVCGISRLSKRSIMATLTFMATGVATVTILRHVVGV